MRKPNRRKAKCHPDRPHASRGYCGSCYAKWLKENNPQFAVNQAAVRKKWIENNPDYERTYKQQELKRKGGR